MLIVYWFLQYNLQCPLSQEQPKSRQHRARRDCKNAAKARRKKVPEIRKIMKKSTQNRRKKYDTQKMRLRSPFLSIFCNFGVPGGAKIGQNAKKMHAKNYVFFGTRKKRKKCAKKLRKGRPGVMRGPIEA